MNYNLIMLHSDAACSPGRECKISLNSEVVWIQLDGKLGRYPWVNTGEKSKQKIRKKLEETSAVEVYSYYQAWEIDNDFRC